MKSLTRSDSIQSPRDIQPAGHARSTEAGIRYREAPDPPLDDVRERVRLAVVSSEESSFLTGADPEWGVDEGRSVCR